jgi:hypothetical protein
VQEVSAGGCRRFAATIVGVNATRDAFAPGLHALGTMPLVFGEGRENGIG